MANSTKGPSTTVTVDSSIAFVAMTVTRFTHIQRYTETSECVLDPSVDKPFLFRCREGKRRVKGTRPAYVWGVPSLSKFCVDFNRAVKPYKVFSQVKPTFLLQRLKASRSRFSTRASEKVRKLRPSTWTPNPTTYSQCIALLRGTLERAGRKPGEATCRTFNALRRFLPTAGQACGFAPEEGQAIGNWVDVPQSASTPSTHLSKNHVASHPMGRHYAGYIELKSISIKLELFKRLWHLRPLRAPSFPNIIPPGCWTWPDLYEEVLPPHLHGSAASHLSDKRAPVRKRKLVKTPSAAASSHASLPV